MVQSSVLKRKGGDLSAAGPWCNPFLETQLLETYPQGKRVIEANALAASVHNEFYATWMNSATYAEFVDQAV
jgi:hypothetical protein